MRKQSTSYGHKVEVLGCHEAKSFDGVRWPCAKCKDRPAEYGITFYCVTGKAGRVTDRWQAVCLDCAIKFATKHGLIIQSEVA